MKQKNIPTSRFLKMDIKTYTKTDIFCLKSCSEKSTYGPKILIFVTETSQNLETDSELQLKTRPLTMKKRRVLWGGKSNQSDTESETEGRIETYPEIKISGVVGSRYCSSLMFSQLANSLRCLLLVFYFIYF